VISRWLNHEGVNVKVVAVTGATGFVGRHLVAALARAGWQVRLLMRRDPVVAEWRDAQPQIVAGDLRDAAALEALVEGVDRVVHVAGLIKAARRESFFSVNTGGSVKLAEALQRRAPDAQLLHVSTLAAREPQLSDYAASKRAGEDAVRRILGARATVIRPMSAPRGTPGAKSSRQPLPPWAIPMRSCTTRRCRCCAPSRWLVMLASCWVRRTC
jgi:uncharacterized protein YbjT (DUF2867 family)